MQVFMASVLHLRTQAELKSGWLRRCCLNQAARLAGQPQLAWLWWHLKHALWWAAALALFLLLQHAQPCLLCYLVPRARSAVSCAMSAAAMHLLGNTQQALPLCVMLPCGAGGSHEGYVKWACVAAASRGWRAVVLNMRGCNGLPLTSARGYNAINTADVHVAVQSIHRCVSELCVGVLTCASSGCSEPQSQHWLGLALSLLRGYPCFNSSRQCRQPMGYTAFAQTRLQPGYMCVRPWGKPSEPEQA